MEEKAKSKVLIYIIVVLVAIIVLLSIGGIYLYKELSKLENDNKLQNELNQEEKQVDKEIQIINDKVAKQNILVNGKVVEVKATITDINQIEDWASYKVDVKVEIDGKETEKIEGLSTHLVENKSNLNASNVFGNIKTIKGEDNKDYIVIKSLEDIVSYYYILNENGKIIATFQYNWFDSVTIKETDEIEDNVQIKDNYIVKYKPIYDDNDYKLEKGKYTIKDDKLRYEVIKKYKANEIQTQKEW